MSHRVRVFIASSLDGFIAGPNDDLSWLPTPDPELTDFGYGAFMSGVGAMLMGRKTYDVVAGFDGPWPYGERPVLVATNNPPPTPAAPTVRFISGEIEAMVAAAKEAAGEGDVYIDGGLMIRQALDAGLIDELIVSIIPVVLGHGSPLFAGLQARRALTLITTSVLPGGIVQLTYRTARP
jgi:dihydrofolate reductase